MPDTPADVISVTELNRLARMALERSLPVRWVTGEISNLTRAASGHWYFTLKDANAAVRCAMFRNRNQFLDWRPENGMQVEVRGQASLYETRGEFQVTVDAMRRAGLGALYEAFARLKDALAREGLFAPERKRPLPPFPNCIGVVTSPKAAALRDVLSTLAQRWPLARVVLYPTPVQGEGAALRIAQAITTAGQRLECDTLLLVRGGGSIEDLWAFNEEVVARALATCPIPVVSGVGHETDFTIADFVADVRAPTPTGAAQLATPLGSDLTARVMDLSRQLRGSQRRRLEYAAQRLDGLGRRLQHPSQRLQVQGRHLAQLARRMPAAWQHGLMQRQRRLERLQAGLERGRPRPAETLRRVDTLGQRMTRAWRVQHQRLGDKVAALASQLGQLNPDAVLERGYAVVRDAQGVILREAAQARPGQEIAIRLHRGTLDAQVTDTRRED